jgi:Ca2+/H+ antiporter
VSPLGNHAVCEGQTFGSRRTRTLHGAVHLVAFAAFVMLIFD